MGNDNYKIYCNFYNLPYNAVYLGILVLWSKLKEAAVVLE